jgi:hypothetical protein
MAAPAYNWDEIGGESRFSSATAKRGIDVKEMLMARLQGALPSAISESSSDGNEDSSSTTKNDRMAGTGLISMFGS